MSRQSPAAETSGLLGLPPQVGRSEEVRFGSEESTRHCHSVLLPGSTP